MFPDFHPAISSSPAILLFVVLFLGLLNIDTKHSINLIRVWAASLVLTYVTGQYAAELSVELTGDALELLSWHQTVGKLLLFSGIILVLLSEMRLKNPEISIVFYYAAGVVFLLTAFNSYQGGSLVFDFGVNVTQPSDR